MSSTLVPEDSLDAATANAFNAELNAEAVFSGLSLDTPTASVQPQALPSAAGESDDTAIASGGGSTQSVKFAEPIYIGEALAFINSKDKLCCAYVGNSGERFCVNKASECDIVSHKKQKAKARDEIKDGLFVLSGTKKGACLTEPSINKENIPTHLVNHLLDEKITMKRAMEIVTLLANRKLKETDTYEEIMASGERIDAVFNTPRKASSKTMDLVTDYPGFAQEWEQRLEVIFQTNATADPSTAPSIEELPKEFKGLSNQVTGIKDHLFYLADALDERFDAISDDTELIETLFFKVKQLQTVIGNQERNRAESSELSPVLWESISNLQQQIQQVEPLIVKREKSVLLELAKVLGPYKNKLLDLDARYTGLSNNVGNLTVEVTKVKNTKTTASVPVTAPASVPTAASSTAAAALGGLGLGTSGVGPTTSGPGTTSGSSGGPSATSLGIGGSVPTGTSTTAPTVPIAPVPSSAPSSISATGAIKDLVDRVQKLEDVLKQKAGQGLSDSTRLCSVTFTKPEDVEDFMIKHGPSSHGIPKYGLFVEPLTLLHWVYAKILGFSSTQSELTNKAKLNLHEHELRAVEAYGHDVPLIYTKESSDLLHTDPSLEKSRLTNLSKFEDFESPGFDSGLRKRLESNLQMVVNSLGKAIDFTFRKHQYVCSLAKEMLNISHKFVLALHNYMTETYTSFKAMGVGSPKQVWGLVTFVVDQLFRNDFASKREDAIGNLDTNTRDSGFIAIWCSIKSVGLAKNLVETGIKETPSISASYIRFVLSQSNMGRVGTLIEENTSLKRKLEETNDQLASVKKIATDAKKVADSAMSKISNIQRGNGNGGGGRGNGGGGRGGARDNP